MRQTIHPYSIFSLFLLSLFVLISCKSDPGASSSGSSASHDGGGGKQSCLLNEAKTGFSCQMSYPRPAGGCEAPGAGVRSEFLNRMVQVSLEMLYLDTEPGASPPYSFRDPGALLSSVNAGKCTERGGECRCTLQYENPFLQEILYDSAGCRYRSRYSSQPLYFRGGGC